MLKKYFNNELILSFLITLFIAYVYSYILSFTIPGKSRINWFFAPNTITIKSIFILGQIVFLLAYVFLLNKKRSLLAIFLIIVLILTIVIKIFLTSKFFEENLWLDYAFLAMWLVIPLILIFIPKVKDYKIINFLLFTYGALSILIPLIFNHPEIFSELLKLFSKPESLIYFAVIIIKLPSILLILSFYLILHRVKQGLIFENKFNKKHIGLGIALTISMYIVTWQFIHTYDYQVLFGFQYLFTTFFILSMFMSFFIKQPSILLSFLLTHIICIGALILIIYLL